MVYAAGVEGRDPVADIKAINAELKAYNPALLERPQVIAANKIDALYGEQLDEAIDRIRNEFKEEGIEVYPISAVSGQGLKELLWHINELLSKVPAEPVEFEPEFTFEMPDISEEPFTVEYDADADEYVVEGPRIERMLGYTNLESEKGFEFFQNFLKTTGILDQLEALGIQEGDTVRMYGLAFDYYR